MCYSKQSRGYLALPRDFDLKKYILDIWKSKTEGKLRKREGEIDKMNELGIKPSTLPLGTCALIICHDF